MIEDNRIYSIKELNTYIKSILDNDVQLNDIWVRGEISNFTHHSSGHMYFTLKDDSSRVRSIMFAGNNRYLKFVPKNGMKVIAKGYISVYERDGQYQFYIQEIQPDGIGQLYMAFEQLKEKLQKEGLFDQDSKQKLPSFPQKIGIITSGTGAAIRDIITTIKRRFPLVHLIIYPVLVQGESAAKTIANAIDQMNNLNEVDVLIVGRGGGSIEELWAFNEEIVARSIFHSKIPVISGVGHETDFTISDFVADIRAATPTAAAELAVPSKWELRTHIGYLANRLEKHTVKQIEKGKASYEQVLKSVVFKRPKQRIIEKTQEVDRLEERLRHSLNTHTSYHKERLYLILHKLMQQKPNHKVMNSMDKLNHLKKRLKREIHRVKEIHSNKLEYKIGKLDALSPLKVMSRGYALPYDEKEKKLIQSIEDVQLGDIIKLHLHNGKLDCQVWGLEEKKNEGK